MNSKARQQNLFPDLPGRGVQNRLALFEDCASAIDQLFQQALQATGPAAFDQFLDFMAGFSNLSAYNAMLVRVQRPGAIAVASRRQWLAIGREVNADAIPIVLLQNFGPVRFAFEFADTYGEEIPGEKLNTLFAEGPIPADQYQRKLAAAEKYGVSVSETDQYGTLLAGTAAALASLPKATGETRKTNVRYRVRINAKHDLPTRFAALAHELGHIYCGHTGADIQGRWPNRSKLCHAQQELEAEAVAWLVCQRTRIATRSKEYLATLATAEHVGAISIYAVFEAANRVESRTAPRKGG